MRPVTFFLSSALAVLPVLFCHAAPAVPAPTANVGIAKVITMTDKSTSRYTGQVVSKSTVRWLTPDDHPSHTGLPL